LRHAQFIKYPKAGDTVKTATMITMAKKTVINNTNTRTRLDKQQGEANNLLRFFALLYRIKRRNLEQKRQEAMRSTATSSIPKSDINA
jgi:hypothetical protein